MCASCFCNGMCSVIWKVVGGSLGLAHWAAVPTVVCLQPDHDLGGGGGGGGVWGCSDLICNSHVQIIIIVCKTE